MAKTQPLLLAYQLPKIGSVVLTEHLSENKSKFQILRLLMLEHILLFYWVFY